VRILHRAYNAGTHYEEDAEQDVPAPTGAQDHRADRAVLIVGFGVSTIVTIQRESAALVEQNKQAVRRLTQTVVASIEAAMMQERPDVIRSLLQEQRELRAQLAEDAAPLEALMIYRRNGVEAFTDLATATEVARAAGLSDEVMKNISKMERAPGTVMAGPLFTRAVETLKTQESLEVENGVSLFTLHHPSSTRRNVRAATVPTTRCGRWYASRPRWSPSSARWRRHRNRQLLIAAMTILAAAAVLTIAMRSVIVGRSSRSQPSPGASVTETSRRGRRLGPRRDRRAGRRVQRHDITAHKAYTELATKNKELETALQSLQESRQRLELLEQLKGELSKFVPDAVKKLLEQNPNATELAKKTVESRSSSSTSPATRSSPSSSRRGSSTSSSRPTSRAFSDHPEPARRRERDGRRRPDGHLPVRPELDRPRAERDTRRLRHPSADGHPERRVRRHLSIDPAPHGDQHRRGAGRRHQARLRGGAAVDVHGHRAHDQRGGALAGSAQGGEIVVGPTTAERIRAYFVLESLGERTFKNVSQPTTSTA